MLIGHDLFLKPLLMMSVGFSSVYGVQRPDRGAARKLATLSALLPENIQAGIMPIRVL
jgi:hypothetical protein